jgi:hypothetical protein
MTQRDGEPHFGFFAPGEVALIVEHEAPLSRDALLRALRAVPLVRDNLTLSRAVEFADASTSVTTTNRRLPESEPAGCARIISAVFDVLLRREASSRPAPQAAGTSPAYLSSVFVNVGQAGDEWNDPRALIERLIAPLDEGLDNGFGQGEHVAVTGVSPNWFISSAQPILTVGGPGARPVAPNGVKATASGVDPWIFRFFDDQGNQLDLGDGHGVDIFVLDTAPTREQFEHAYNNGQPLNPMLGKLLAPDGSFSLNNRRFEVRYSGSTKPEIDRLGSHTQGVGVSGHDYEMLDHGLFASGTAALVAPAARVTLMEVLGRWGVGSLRTILDALNTLTQRPASRPMIVNLSLTFDIPFSKHLVRHADVPQFQTEWGWFSKWLDEHESFVSRSLNAVEEACRALKTQHKALVVAAAGNDSFGAEQRRGPRFPAAFDAVIGVGALSSHKQPAPYSNRPDKPEIVGVIAFGGDLEPSGAGPGATPPAQDTPSANRDTGILGLYIGMLPDGTQAVDGWARWAGTSFSAPIVAGYLAAALGTGQTPAQALATLAASAAESSGQSQRLNVTQG